MLFLVLSIDNFPIENNLIFFVTEVLQLVGKIHESGLSLEEKLEHCTSFRAVKNKLSSSVLLTALCQ